MSRRNKLHKFAELLTFPNVYENFDAKNPILTGKDGEELQLKGQWKEKHFKNKNPIILELACGYGEYSVHLAQTYPDRNFIGVDIKGARIWQGAKKALEEDLINVAFLRTRIEQLNHFFEKGEVTEIWITFPDPFLRESKVNRRLTSAHFLNIYKKLLRPGASIHLKTDESQLYEFTLETLTEQDEYQLRYFDDDIYCRQLPLPELAIKTRYEKIHLAKGKTIKYIRFDYTPK